MATSASERRQQVMVGELPNDFLRIPGSAEQQQIAADHQTAALLQAQVGGGGFFLQPGNTTKLSITVAQAKMTKNYGLTKMDPYCRIRVGHSIFETPTDHNGAKNPRWNKQIMCYIPNGVDSIYIEIFDERAFTMDERIAWAHVRIPESVLNGDTSDEWYTLSGKQGDDKEGMINIILTITQAAAPAMPPQMVQQPIIYSQPAPVMMVPAGAPVFYPQQPVLGVIPPGGHQPPMMQQQQQQQQPQGPLYTEEDIKQVKDMFPNIEEEVIKSVLEANRGNKDTTINNLLTMNS